MPSEVYKQCCVQNHLLPFSLAVTTKKITGSYCALYIPLCKPVQRGGTEFFCHRVGKMHCRMKRSLLFPLPLSLSSLSGEMAPHSQPTSGMYNRSILLSFILVFCCCNLVAFNHSNTLSRLPNTAEYKRQCQRGIECLHSRLKRQSSQFKKAAT